MAKHLSLRLPWHDRGWDGHVCDNPTANVYCVGEYGLKAHGIREGKVDKEEESRKGQPLAVLKTGYVPPCQRTIQAFGGTTSLPFAHAPKDFLHTKRVSITSIPDTIPPYTAGTWPYDRVFRRADDAEEGTPDEFIERYAPQEAIDNIKDFFDAFTKRSLVFFYLNYDNPLNSERRRYVLVGAAEIDAVSEQHHWAAMDPDVERIYGSMVWNRFVTHGYGEGRGARLPYERYLQRDLDPNDILVEVADDISPHFKYVCRAFSDDEAAILLQELVGALERGRNAKVVEWDWDRQIQWINSTVDKVLKNRGIFPGLGAVLGALGFPNAIIYAQKALFGQGVKDPRKHALERLDKPDLSDTPQVKKGYEIARNTLKLLPEPTRHLLLDRLCLFELNIEQVKLIAGGDLVTAQDRRLTGLTSDATALLENPYLIVEEYDPIDREDKVPFHRIDHGIYLAKASGDNPVPGVDAFGADDRRRLRAAAVLRLRGAMTEGHSFLSQEELLASIIRLRLSGVGDGLGPVTFARDLDFYEQRLTFIKTESITGWMLRTLAEDEELIRARVAKLQQRKAIDPGEVDWKKLLPKDSRLPAATLREVRESQSLVLDRLSRQPVSVLTGGAGTGKTTVLATLIKGLQSGKNKEKFVLLAPTGKAAVRLRRKIQEVAEVDLEPRTIHSYLLGRWIEPTTFRPLRDGEPIADGATTVIIDECSMIDTVLLTTVFRAIDWTKVRRLILSGDPQQLPPIGVGAPFKNLVDHIAASEEEAHHPCRLTVNCRQIEEGSTALLLAQQFTPAADRVLADELLAQVRNGGRIGADLEIRFFKDEKDLPDTLETLVADAVTELLSLNKSHTVWDKQQPWVAYDELHGFGRDLEEMRLDAFEILSPYRGGYFGSDAINSRVQDLLRGKLMKGWANLKLGKQSGRQFIAPDKVLQVQNKRVLARQKLAWDGKKNVDFYVANGELGRMMKVDKFAKQKIGRVRFETNRQVSVSVSGKWAEEALDLGYAMTIHKAQGSDFGGVVVVLPTEQRQRMISRELLYTALTRFTRRLYLVVQGTPGDVAPLFSGLWRGASDYFRRNTCLYRVQHAPPDLDDYRPEKRIIRTLRGDFVASKSEALIANILASQKIPYYYEERLTAPDGSPRRPDFTIPIETPDGPDVLYWEHWGKLGDPDYEASVERRRKWYKAHGFFPKLIETDEKGGFDSKRIEEIIRSRILS